MIVKTRNGLFANAGYGGGTFNGNTAFGSYQQGQSMRQHQYQDVSNLGAPYDNMSVQGLGLFGSAGFGGVGAEDSVTVPLLPSALPWMVASDTTKPIQVALNTQLKSEGYNLLKEDGILGPRTCGAMQKYGSLAASGGTCDAHTSEFIAPTKASTASQAATVVKDVVKQGGMPVWVWAALAGAGVIGAAVYVKKRKHR